MQSKGLRIAAWLVGLASLVMFLLALLTGKFEFLLAPAIPLLLMIYFLFIGPRLAKRSAREEP